MLFLRNALTILGGFWFHTHFNCVYVFDLKNAVGMLGGNTSNLL